MDGTLKIQFAVYLWCVCAALLIKGGVGQEKAGLCPQSAIGVCAEMCSSDQSCPGSQKCCSNGCGHQCMMPTLDNCAVVMCAQVFCPGQFVPPGQCCPICPGNAGYPGQG